MCIDPFSLAALGIGVLGSGIGAAVNAAKMPGRKRKYIREQKAEALHNMRRNYAANVSDWPVGPDGAYIAKKIQNSADENFQVDPMSFVPFVGSATQLAGGLYDAGLSDPNADSLNQNEQFRTVPEGGRYRRTPTNALERAQALKHFKSIYGDDYEHYSK